MADLEDEDEYEKTVMISRSAAAKKSETPKARLVCRNAEQVSGGAGSAIILEGGEIIVGSDDDASVVLKADGVAGKHARIYPSGKSWGIADLAGSDGIKINEDTMDETWLKPGDSVQIGSVIYTFLVGDEPAPEAATPVSPNPAEQSPAAPGPTPAAKESDKAGVSNKTIVFAIIGVIILIAVGATILL